MHPKPMPTSGSRRRLLIPHQGLNLADAPQCCLPDLQLKGAAPIPRRQGSAALGYLGFKVTAGLEDIPELPLQPSPLDEVPALQPGGEGGHRFGLRNGASLAEAPEGAAGWTRGVGRADATVAAAAELGKVPERPEQSRWKARSDLRSGRSATISEAV